MDENEPKKINEKNDVIVNKNNSNTIGESKKIESAKGNNEK